VNICFGGTAWTEAQRDTHTDLQLPEVLLLPYALLQPQGCTAGVGWQSTGVKSGGKSKGTK